MLIPVRCFTCGSLVGEKYDTFKARVTSGEEPGKVLDDMGLKRYCCRRMLLSGFEIVDYQVPYFEAIERRRKDL
ncbi:MAG: DNA-directed RNA polymerase subunit N [Nitrososphaerota archaeon]|nr:DNA-directed RNA polymerase subunit N [Nitrososphaerota archaeon]MDG6939538.1 DNA-directed RNA polymerase subunit N [Nitrososphaerota archaeon]